MSKIFLWSVVTWLSLGVLFDRPLNAQTRSLWEKRDDRKAFLFRDLKARKIGDILTISINENTDVANSDTRALNKQTSINGNGGFSYSGISAAAPNASINSDSSRGFSGDVNFSSDRQFLDTFSVTVVDVLPNGNMVIHGSRDVMIEGDRKKLAVSGVIRDLDIRSDNSVRSSNIARLKITYSGYGKAEAFTQQGWLGSAVNRFWPF